MKVIKKINSKVQLNVILGGAVFEYDDAYYIKTNYLDKDNIRCKALRVYDGQLIEFNLTKTVIGVGAELVIKHRQVSW